MKFQIFLTFKMDMQFSDGPYKKMECVTFTIRLQGHDYITFKRNIKKSQEEKKSCLTEGYIISPNKPETSNTKI